jgi:ADP-dependent NAD(P)H-hydrate dehydratase
MTDEPTVVTSAVLRDWPLPEVSDGDGKRDRGTVVVVGGASDTPGAVLLAGLAALRVGAGRLTLATVTANATALAVAVPEAAVIGLPATPDGCLGADAVDAVRDAVADADAVVLGPGLRGPDDARRLVTGLAPALSDKTLVLDALGLTCGALDDAAFREHRPGRLVATPNTAEAGRLLGTEVDRADVDGAVAVRLAEELDAVVALESHVATPDGRRWVDGSGNSGLGTSGSGDVLAGAIGGLAARGAGTSQAAVWGVHLHAEAGERLAAAVGRLGYLARELLDALPRVLAELDSQRG